MEVMRRVELRSTFLSESYPFRLDDYDRNPLLFRLSYGCVDHIVLCEDPKDSLICLECHCAAVFWIRKNDELVSWVLVVQNLIDLVLRLKQRVRLRAAAPSSIHAVSR